METVVSYQKWILTVRATNVYLNSFEMSGYGLFSFQTKQKHLREELSSRISQLQSRVEKIKISLGLQKMEGEAFGILLLHGIIWRHTHYFFLSFCRLPLIPGNRTLIFLMIKNKTDKKKPSKLIILRQMGGKNALNMFLLLWMVLFCVANSVNLEWISF